MSKLSGWLNADAPCRVQRQGIDEGDTEGQDKRREGVGAVAYVTRGVGPTGERVAWAGAERTANM